MDHSDGLSIHLVNQLVRRAISVRKITTDKLIAAQTVDTVFRSPRNTNIITISLRATPGLLQKPWRTDHGAESSQV